MHVAEKHPHITIIAHLLGDENQVYTKGALWESIIGTAGNYPGSPKNKYIC